MSTPQTAVLLLLAVLAGLGYAAACRWWPYSRCWACDGSGKRTSPGGKHWRPCRRCGGSGTRIRLGRRLFTAGRRYSQTD
jgi:hypothetical protein